MSYTVGVAENGDTVLKVGPDGGMITTMTMNEGAVVQMIKLLAATLSTVSVDISVKENENGGN